MTNPRVQLSWCLFTVELENGPRVKIGTKPTLPPVTTQTWTRGNEWTSHMSMQNKHWHFILFFPLELEGPSTMIFKLCDWFRSWRWSTSLYTTPWGPEGPKNFVWMENLHVILHGTKWGRSKQFKCHGGAPYYLLFWIVHNLCCDHSTLSTFTLY